LTASVTSDKIEYDDELPYKYRILYSLAFVEVCARWLHFSYMYHCCVLL